MLNPTIDLAENESIQKNFSVSNIYILLNLSFHTFIACVISYFLPNNGNSLNNFLSKYLNINITPTVTSDIIDIIYYSLFLYVLVMALGLLYLRLSNNYYLTDKRLIIREGLFSIEIKTIEYDKITDMETSQTFLERLISMSGDLFVSTAGANELDANLYNIDSPTELKASINTLRDKLKE